PSVFSGWRPLAKNPAYSEPGRQHRPCSHTRPALRWAQGPQASQGTEQTTGLVSTTRSSIHTSRGAFIGWKLHAPTKSWVMEGPSQGDVTAVGATQALPWSSTDKMGVTAPSLYMRSLRATESISKEMHAQEAEGIGVVLCDEQSWKGSAPKA